MVNHVVISSFHSLSVHTLFVVMPHANASTLTSRYYKNPSYLLDSFNIAFSPSHFIWQTLLLHLQTKHAT